MMVRRTRLWRRFLLLGPILACGSTGSNGGAEQEFVDYGIEIFNGCSAQIHQAQVSFGSYRSRPTNPGPGRTTGEALIEEPVPETAVVQWQDGEGTAHRLEVEVLKGMPRGFEGNIVFDIRDGDQVVVRFAPWPDPGF